MYFIIQTPCDIQLCRVNHIVISDAMKSTLNVFISFDKDQQSALISTMLCPAFYRAVNHSVMSDAIISKLNAFIRYCMINSLIDDMYNSAVHLAVYHSVLSCHSPTIECFYQTLSNTYNIDQQLIIYSSNIVYSWQ